MTLRKISSGRRRHIWLNDYPYGEITKVESFLERSFDASISSGRVITRAAMKVSGGHESDNLVGAEFIPDASGFLKIRVPESGTVIRNSQYAYGYEMDSEIANKIMTQLVILAYLQSESLVRLGSGTLNVTSTGYDWSFSRGRGALPVHLPPILFLLWSDTYQLSDVDVLRRLRNPFDGLTDSDLFQRLCHGLDDEDSLVRAEIVSRLTDVNHSGVVDILINTLLHDDEIIATTARSLGRIGNKAAVEPLIDVLMRYNLTDDAISHIATALSGLKDVRATASLLEILKTTTTFKARRSIIAALGILKSKEALPVLMTIALDEPEHRLQHAAIVALGNIGDPEALTVLENEALLEPDHDWIRNATIEAIGEIGSISDVNILVNLAHEEDDDYDRTKIIETIGKIGGDVPPVWDLLISDLHKSGNKFKYSVAETMITLNPEQAEKILLDYLPTLDIHDELSKSAVIRALVQLNAEKYLYLLEQECRTGSIEKRSRLIVALGKSKNLKVIPTLVQIMYDVNEESQVRVEAADALGDIGSREASLDLIAILDDEDANLVGKAIYALEQIHDERAISKLMDLLYDNRSSYYHGWYVYMWAESALRKFGDRPDVIEAVNLAFKKRNKLDGYE